MSEKKSPLIPILIGVVLIAGAGFYFFQQHQKSAPSMETSGDVMTDSRTAEEPNTQNQEAEKTSTNTETSTSQSTNRSGVSSSSVNIDVEQALTVKALGNPDAPVVMQEFASLTCGHCGTFHVEAFDQIKAEYIDTGKVYFKFIDFPLNGPALHAGMIARCMAPERYFTFLDMLFKSQDKWAYDSGYLTYLRQNAALAGLGNDAFDACISNEDLRTGLTNAMRESQRKYNISSTPTFVFNEDTVVTGARNFEFFKNIIEEELAKVQ